MSEWPQPLGPVDSGVTTQWPHIALNGKRMGSRAAIILGESFLA